MNLTRTLKYYCLRVRNLKGDPKSIALGMAIGVFVGLTPTIPFHTIIILLAATFLRGSRVAGIVSGTLICNPFTIPVIYYLTFRIGKWIMSSNIVLPQTYSILTICRTGWELMLTMLIGGVILAIGPTLLSYFITYHSFKRLAARRKAKHLALCNK